jgi:hypothetical protein
VPGHLLEERARRSQCRYGPGAIDDQVTLVRKRQYPPVGRGGSRLPQT